MSHAVYSDFFTSKPKWKPKGYHVVCVQYVVLACYMSVKQMAKSNQCQVPTNQVQRLDHTTKLESSWHCVITPAKLSAPPAPMLL